MNQPAAKFRLLFRSLFVEGRAFAFDCDERGRVNLDQLCDRARNNYFYVRAAVGREFAWPIVDASEVRSSTEEYLEAASR